MFRISILGFLISIVLVMKMQNKPNFQNAQMTTTPLLTTPYKNLPLHGGGKNKAKQTQNKAIPARRSLGEDGFNPSAPYQSQNKPNFTRHSFSEGGPNPIFALHPLPIYLFTRLLIYSPTSDVPNRLLNYKILQGKKI